MPSANMNTLSGLPNQNKIFYDRTLLKRMLPNLVYAKYGQSRPLRKNEGDTINFRKFSPLPPATTPLTEGITPAGSKIAVEKIEATVQQYGDYIEVTDILDMLGIDPVITENSQLLGEQAALTIDNLVRDVVVSGTTVHFAGNGLDSDSITANDKLTGTIIKRAVRTLKNNNAKPVSGGFFIGIVDPDTAYDLMEDPLWQDVSKYNGGTAIMKNEIGKLHGVRFIETTETKVEANAGGIDVHSVMILGADAYGVVDVERSAKGKPEIIVKPRGSSGTEDPLNQRGTQGWTALFTTVRLNELAMCRIECAVSE